MFSSSAPTADPGSQPLIRFESVTKRFGATLAVDDLSLDILDGEFFCLLGPSGCGKSTLMRLLAGFEEPSAGRVVLAGQDLAGVPPYRRPVNMMFQSYALFPHMTVAGNVAYGLKQEGSPRNEIQSRVAEMLRLVQLAALGDRRPDQLSGGQRQRVALARALARRPRVLLLDEPLAALDKKLREETQVELKRIQAQLGTTFIVVTHDQAEAMSMADRIAVMDRGRIAQVAAPAELYERPATRFVAEFVGDVNVIEGRVVGRDGEAWRIVTAWDERPLLVEGSGAFQAGEAVVVAIRPEKMTIDPGEPARERANSIAAQVSEVVYLGDTTIYRLKAEGGTALRASRPNATRVSPQPIGPGDRVRISFPYEAAILLRP